MCGHGRVCGKLAGSDLCGDEAAFSHVLFSRVYLF